MAFVRFHITHDFPPRQDSETNKWFQDQYLALRQKEKRLYSDEQVKHLPVIANDHPHYKEWQARKYSSEKLLKRISKMKRPLRILEIGCGNGWLSSKLANQSGTSVVGFDINLVELQQAKRVFGHQLNLQFISRDPFVAGRGQDPFDLIIFAASIQYFSSLEDIISNALLRLHPGGSIHIIDSHFYRSSEVPAARERTAEYYRSLGFPGLSNHYFHHSLRSLNPFNFQLLYNPNTIWNKLQRKKHPFHWICIKK